MIGVPVTLILGAGASVPYGFPVGKTLMDDISKNLQNKNSHISARMVSIYSDWGRICDFGSRLGKANRPSIDDFLWADANKPLIEIGKTAIAFEILNAENRNNVEQGNERGWYKRLWSKMGVSVKELYQCTKNLNIITFNYDRSLEYFFYSAMKNTHNQQNDLIMDFIDRLSIFHVHGSVGKLKYDMQTGSVDYGDFSKNYDLKTLRDASTSIIILPEAEQGWIDDPFVNPTTLISRSEVLGFIGFGYHPISLNRILMDVDISQKEVYGSAFKMPLADRQDVENYFKKAYGVEIKLGAQDEDALAFLENHPVLRQY